MPAVEVGVITYTTVPEPFSVSAIGLLVPLPGAFPLIVEIAARVQLYADGTSLVIK